MSEVMKTIIGGQVILINDLGSPVGSNSNPSPFEMYNARNMIPNDASPMSVIGIKNPACSGLANNPTTSYVMEPATGRRQDGGISPRDE